MDIVDVVTVQLMGNPFTSVSLDCIWTITTRADPHTRSGPPTPSLPLRYVDFFWSANPMGARWFSDPSRWRAPATAAVS